MRWSSTASSESFSGSWFTGTGRSGSARATTWSEVTCTSKPPGALSLADIWPSTITTDSGVTSALPSSTHWAVRERSRSSRKELLPSSRTRCTQPRTSTSSPACFATSASNVRIGFLHERRHLVWVFQQRQGGQQARVGALGGQRSQRSLTSSENQPQPLPCSILMWETSYPFRSPRSRRGRTSRAESVPFGFCSRSIFRA